MSSVAIKNARVFNGKTMEGIRTVVIENGMISDKTSGETTLDASGCTLLPGLFDCHVHLEKPYFLDMAAKKGVTTMVDCGTRIVETVNNQKNLTGCTKIISGYQPAFGPNSQLRKNMMFPENCRVRDREDVKRYVSEMIANGADFIKIILEENDQNGGVDFPADIAAELVDEAHRNGKLVITHAASIGTYKLAAQIGADILTHMPFSAPMPQEVIDLMASKKLACVPTLVMMKGIIEALLKMLPQLPFSIDVSLNSLSSIREAGIKVLAGTDSNLEDPTTLAAPPFGEALHDELVLMTSSGYTPTEVLRSATADPAEFFSLKDRGTIEAGKKADLLLVQGDPTVRMEDIRNVKNVWIDGVQIAV